MALAGAGSGAEIMDKGGGGGAEAENKLFLLRNTAFFLVPDPDCLFRIRI